MIPEQKHQELDKEYFSCLLSIFSTYPLFRFTVYYTISKIIYEFTCSISPNIPQEYDILLRNACCDIIIKLQRLLESKEHSELLLDMFDDD